MRFTVEAMVMRRRAAFCVFSRAAASGLVCWAACESVERAMAESAICDAWLAAVFAAFFCWCAEYIEDPTVAAAPTSPPMIAAVPMMLNYELRVTKYEVE